MDIAQGDIYWLDIRHPIGSEPGFRRPCVVVQNDSFNISRINTVLVCPLTSTLQQAKVFSNVLLEPGEAGLSRRSVVVTSQIITANKAECQEYVGRLSAHRMREVIAGIHLVIEP